MDGDEAHVTALGERLLCTDPHSEAERAVFYDAIQVGCHSILVPELLSLYFRARTPSPRLFAQANWRATALRKGGLDVLESVSLAMLHPLSGHVERAGNPSP